RAHVADVLASVRVERLDAVPVEAHAALQPDGSGAEFLEQEHGSVQLVRRRGSRGSAGLEVLPAHARADGSALERAQPLMARHGLACRAHQAEFGADDARRLQLAVIVVRELAVEVEGAERSQPAAYVRLAVQAVAA